jgi:alpha-N-arabinofuranosidase
MLSDSHGLSTSGMTRRHVLQGAALTAAAILAETSRATGSPASATLNISPKPLFELSPYLYMQFMEPLGTTDGSVEASWDHLQQRWRPDLITATRELAPTMMRWGGLFSGYYHWREGVGPRAARRPMHNLMWGGMESNQIGTGEFLDFCKQVGAQPLMCVNFEGEGDPLWRKNLLGELRAGDAKEAADWVDYCNSPGNADRISHGFKDAMPIGHWQLGNETSFSPQRFKRLAAIAKTIEFSTAMRKVDKSIKLIGWGDSGWAPTMIEQAGEHIDYVAFHHLFDPGPPLRDGEYRKDPQATWEVLMATVKRQEKKLLHMRQQVEPHGFPLALTECHFTMQGRNRCDLNSAWATGVAYARFLNLHQRHGDLLKIANLGDFCGTRWQSNVIMLPTPRGAAYIMPVGKVSALYRHHTGTHFTRCQGGPDDLDITTSRTGDTFFAHIVNTHRTQSRRCGIAIDQLQIKSGKAFEIAVDPEAEITSAQDDLMQVKTREINTGNAVEFPAASVTVLELQV